jgi:predicted P-loop ATPase/nitrogen regulatory protein PII-like uncharacterized protein
MPSYFENALARVPKKSMSIEDIRQFLQKPPREHKIFVEELRIESDEGVQDKMKKTLPAVTFSGEFTARKASALEKHTGLYVYDLDGVSPDKVKKSIKNESSLVMAFMSPRANGLKVVLRGPVVEDAALHKKAWEAGALIIENLTHEKIDKSGSDVCRLCFLSTDKGFIEGDGEEFAVGAAGDDDDGIMAGVPEPKADFSGYTSHVVKEMLWTIGSELPYEQWRNVIWAVVSHLGKADWVREMLLKWSKERGGSKALKGEEAEKTFEAVFTAKGKGVTLATLVAAAKKAGWVDWRKLMRRDEEGELMHDEQNLRILLENHPDFKGRLWTDSLSGSQTMDPRKDVLTCEISRKGGFVEAWVANDVLCDIQGNIGMGFRGARTVLETLVAIAKQNVRNIRKEWLDGLTWDGIPRVNRLFIDGFGAEEVERNEALAVAFMAGAAARVMYPGVPVHVVPVLIGKQGCGKSSGIGALCPFREWFCDSFVDLESKAGYEVVLRATIVELSEMSAIRKADLEKVKQFVTQTSVRFRAPYEKTTADHNASWVFIGTTNEEEFLKDTSGNRRFAPIKIVKARVEAVVEWVTEHRDQLWAEAVTIVKKGLKERKETWGVPKKFWDELEVVAERAREKDPWEDMLKEYSDGLLRKDKKICKRMHDIAIEAGLPIRNRSEELHLGKLLRHSGWRNIVVKIEGKAVRRWTIEAL